MDVVHMSGTLICVNRASFNVPNLKIWKFVICKCSNPVHPFYHLPKVTRSGQKKLSI